VINGLSEVGIKPDYNLLVIEHTKYVDTLLKLGLKVDVLDPDDTLPDSVFVEDPALTFANGTILLEPGAPSRKGERGLIQPHLTQTFDTVFKLVEGSAEGGDVLRLNHEVLIGLSDRTNELGARALKKLLLELGQESRIVETPRGVLHFKSDCSALDEDTILATPRLANSGIFENYNVILTPENEYSAANSLRVNEKLLVPNGYPRTAELLSKKFDVEIVGITEVAKLDAGLSCMSLRW
jgi:dimethylargininase